MLRMLCLLMMAALLAGCGLGAAPTPLPTVMLDGGSGTVQTEPTQASAVEGDRPVAEAAAQPAREVTASGVVVPARQAALASASGGMVEEVLVAAGEQVQAGQALLRLAGAEQRAAALEAARLALQSAEQDAQNLRDGAAQAAAAAQLRLANANKALDQAAKTRGYREYRNGSDAAIDSARADVILARQALDQAQAGYNGVSGQDEDSVTRAGALSALSAAQKAYDRAVGNLNYLLAMPDPLDVAVAEAQLQAAQAEADAARLAYETVKDGPDPARLALAQQQVASAQAQVTAAEAALRDAAFTAPFAATVVSITAEAGAWAAPGQPLVSLADLNHLQVRTSDLSERDVVAVQPGQPALLAVRALDVELAGRVTEIAALAQTLGGDVVYPVTIDLLDPAPTGLRPGMTVDVRFVNP